MTTRTRKPAAERKSEIVDTAIRLAAVYGPDRLTTEQLAKEIGISQPAIFRHFPSKSDIWEAVALRVCDLMGASAALDFSADPAQRLHDMVCAHLNFIEKPPAVPAARFSLEVHAENETLRKVFADLMTKRQARLAELISAGMEAGSFRKDLNASDAAYLILTMIQGLAMRWSLENRKFDLVKKGEQLFELQIVSYKS